MRLPDIFSEDKPVHLTLLFLSFANLLLLVVFFVLVLAPVANLIEGTPISPKVPIVRLFLLSPQSGTAVSGMTPLVMTLANSPMIEKAELQVDSKIVQTVFTQQTGKLTLFWDTTKHLDGSHKILATVIDQKGREANITARFEVKNSISRSMLNQ